MKYTVVIDNGPEVVIPPTTATVALDRIVLTPWSGSNQRKTVLVAKYNLPSTGAACNTNATVIGEYEVGPGHSTIDEPTTPIILAPTSTPAWCLAVTVTPPTTGDGFNTRATFGGFVAKGTLPAS